MRWIVSFIAAAFPYFAASFIMLEPNAFEWTVEGRFFLVVFIVFFFVFSATCPIWTYRK